MNKNQLSIRLHGEPVGVLEQTPTGKKQFTYNQNPSMAISLSMPIREESYGGQLCEAYFGGLLPESEAAKQLIAKKYKISPNNSFALLQAIGHDCAGAISCHTLEDPILAVHSLPIKGRIIPEDELYKHIKELPRKPLFMDVEGLKLSLAGVQDKAAICLIDNQIAIPEDGSPTTHILKPSSPNFPGMAENEYFVMKLAKRIGLLVPKVELRKINDITFLLVQRYDRKVKNNYIERIHQEDFCQALGILSSKKYQNEGGPGFEECFSLLNTTTQPAIDRNRLISGIIFNYLLGNMDAHGKNFSLLHHTDSHIRLTPFYDLICTRVYGELNSKMAMKIGSKYDANEVFPRHWKLLSEKIKYNFIALTHVIEELGNQIKQAMILEKKALQMEGTNHRIIDEIIQFTEGNIDRVVQQLHSH